jgi:hypothetical protein
MSIFRIQQYIWIPLQRQHLVASLCSAGATIVFGLFGFGGFPAFKTYAEITANNHQLRVFDLLLFAASYLFLWRQAFPSYLRLRRSFAPVLVSLVVLSIIAVALTASFTPAPKTSLPSAATAVSPPKAAPSPTAASPQKWNWLRLLLIAQGGLAVVILTSGLWKNDDETIASFARYLAEVRRLRARFENGITVTEEIRGARKALVFYLDALIEWLQKNEYLTDLGPPPGRAAALLEQCKDARQTAADLDIGYYEKVNGQQQKFKFLDPITNFS